LFFLCLQVNFENLLGGGTLDELVNDYISTLLPVLVDSHKGPILLDIVEATKGIANEMLIGFSLEDLLDLINNSK
jgi:hypothetical protein